MLVVAFRPDGRTLVTGSEDLTARLWDTATDRSLGLMVRHNGKVQQVASSPDGRIILSAGWDGTARLWEPPEPVRGEVDRVLLGVQVRTGLALADNEVVHVLGPTAWQQAWRRLEELGGSPWP